MSEKVNLYQGCAGSISPFDITGFDYSKGEYIAEEKYDGIWLEANFDAEGNVRLFSRSGKEKDNTQLDSLRSYLKRNLKLKNSSIVGELAFGSQKGTEFAKAHGHHKIDCFDILKLDGADLSVTSLLDRKNILHGLIGGFDQTWIKETPYEFVKSGAEVKDMYERIVARGGEGLIVKDLNDEDYRFGGKSPLWYKIKKFVTFEYVIVGYTKTNSADFAQRGWIGGVVGGLYEDGKLLEKVTVGSMTFEWRNEFSVNGDAYIGSVMEVGGYEVFKSGSMRHPSFIGIRDDKMPQECVWGKDE